MSETKWTPGPWYARDTANNGWSACWKDDDSHPVCHMRWTDDLRAEVNERVKADAILIAAAPELYEALEKLLHEARPYIDLVREEMGNTNAKVYELRLSEAQDALAKARGEKP